MPCDRGCRLSGDVTAAFIRRHDWGRGSMRYRLGARRRFRKRLASPHHPVAAASQRLQSRLANADGDQAARSRHQRLYRADCADLVLATANVRERWTAAGASRDAGSSIFPCPETEENAMEAASLVSPAAQFAGRLGPNPGCRRSTLGAICRRHRLTDCAEGRA